MASPTGACANTGTFGSVAAPEKINSTADLSSAIVRRYVVHKNLLAKVLHGPQTGNNVLESLCARASDLFALTSQSYVNVSHHINFL